MCLANLGRGYAAESCRERRVAVRALVGVTLASRTLERQRVEALVKSQVRNDACVPQQRCISSRSCLSSRCVLLDRRSQRKADATQRIGWHPACGSEQRTDIGHAVAGGLACDEIAEQRALDHAAAVAPGRHVQPVTQLAPQRRAVVGEPGRAAPDVLEGFRSGCEIQVRKAAMQAVPKPRRDLLRGRFTLVAVETSAPAGDRRRCVSGWCRADARAAGPSQGHCRGARADPGAVAP